MKPLPIRDAPSRGAGRAVERHIDDAFALIGIDTADSESAFRNGVKRFGVTWDCAWQGPKQTPIANLYGVTSYPTIYVLDAQGRIRFKNLRGKALDDAIATLLAVSDDGKRE